MLFISSNVDSRVDDLINLSIEHQETLIKLSTPYEKSVEEFSYCKNLQEIVDDIRGQLTTQEFQDLIIYFDFYGKY